MGQDLPDEVGVAFRLPVEGERELVTGFGEVVPSRGLEEGDDAGIVETGERDLAHPRLSPESDQGGGERVGVGELRAAIGADDEEPDGVVARHQETEELEARLVGPLEVVEHEDQDLGLRHLAQQTDGGAQEEVALGVRIGALPDRELAQSLAEGGHHPGQLGTVGVDVRGEDLVGRGGDVVVQGLGKRTVGRGEVLVAAPEQDAGTRLVGEARRVGGQGRLADSGIARRRRRPPDRHPPSPS